MPNKYYNPQDDVVQIKDGKRTPVQAYDLYQGLHNGPRQMNARNTASADNQKAGDKKEPIRYFQFDGEKLTFIDNSEGKHIETSIEAVSGRPNEDNSFSYDKNKQKQENKGPIPEGVHEIDVATIRKTENMTFIDKIGIPSPVVARIYDPTFGKILGKIKPRLKTAKIGNFPGGTDAWGEGRVDVTLDQTAPQRKGLTIHGGSTPGSAGCIDVVDNDKEFFNILEDVAKKQRKIPLIVDYSNTPKKVWWKKEKSK